MIQYKKRRSCRFIYKVTKNLNLLVNLVQQLLRATRSTLELVIEPRTPTVGTLVGGKLTVVLFKRKSQTLEPLFFDE